jgi:hypothetical protein
MAPCRACERVAIVAGASRTSRQGLHRRLARFRAGGDSSSRGRSIKPGRTTSTTKSHRATAVLATRARLRYRPTRAKPETVHPARRVSRSLKGTRSHCRQASLRPRESGCEQHGPRRLVGPDRVAWNGPRRCVTRSSGNSRGEHCRLHERPTASIDRKTNRIGIDGVLAAVDDHARLTRAEIRPDEKDTTAAERQRSSAASSAPHTVETLETMATVRSHARCPMRPVDASTRERGPC